MRTQRSLFELLITLTDEDAVELSSQLNQHLVYYYKVLANDRATSNPVTAKQRRATVPAAFRVRALSRVSVRQSSRHPP